MMENLFDQSLIDRIRDHSVVLFWSGGIESTCLMDSVIKQKLYSMCDLTVIMVAFPQDLYLSERIDEAKEYLSSFPISFVVLSPKETITHDYPYASACAVCKSIRRRIIVDYLEPLLSKNEETVLITGHSLDDLASYTLELIADLFQDPPAASRLRLLECTNKFYNFFRYNNKVVFMRPLIKVSKKELEIVKSGPLKIVHDSCYWFNQRKRILQHYFESSGIQLSYESVNKIFLQNFNMPEGNAFREIPFDVYLM